ncbi:MAG: ABC transporter permease [Myxococcales bacterium FL481]|nr:MAG: ABC transporter permease [Myxococcales bacterium FL481]
MSKIRIIAWRELLAIVRTKAFIIGLLMAPAFIVVGVLMAPSVSEDELAEATETIVIASADSDIADRVRAQLPLATIEFVDYPTLDTERRQALDARLVAGSLDLVLEIAPSVAPTREVEPAIAAAPAIALRTTTPTSSLPLALKRITRDLVQRARLTATGLTPGQVEQLSTKPTVSIVDPTVTPFLTMLLVFMTVLSGGTQLLNATIEEKQQRIAEVLLGSVSPEQLMAGKLLGAVSVALTMVAVYLTGGIAYASWAGYGELVDPIIVATIFVQVAIATLMFGALFVACGAASNDAKDAQAYLTPLMMLLTAPLFAGSAIMTSPNGPLAIALSLFPLSAPSVMPMRMSLSNSVPMWQPALSLISELMFTAALVWLAGRIFRVGLLAQGKRPSLRELWRWIRRA